MNDHPDKNSEDEAAGQRLPEQDISAGICPEPLAPLLEGAVTTSEKAISVMVFRVKSTWFALKTNLFHKVADIALPHTVPGKTDSRFLGIVNAGGELELCFSLADILGIAEMSDVMPEGMNHPRLVVIGTERNRFAFAVEEILGIRSVSPGDLLDFPAMQVGSDQNDDMPTVAVDGKKVGLLNDRKLFDVLTRSLSDEDE
jgi:chemotaxis signal transduction protein